MLELFTLHLRELMKKEILEVNFSARDVEDVYARLPSVMGGKDKEDFAEIVIFSTVQNRVVDKYVSPYTPSSQVIIDIKEERMRRRKNEKEYKIHIWCTNYELKPKILRMKSSDSVVEIADNAAKLQGRASHRNLQCIHIWEQLEDSCFSKVYEYGSIPRFNQLAHEEARADEGRAKLAPPAARNVVTANKKPTPPEPDDAWLSTKAYTIEQS